MRQTSYLSLMLDRIVIKAFLALNLICCTQQLLALNIADKSISINLQGDYTITGTYSTTNNDNRHEINITGKNGEQFNITLDNMDLSSPQWASTVNLSCNDIDGKITVKFIIVGNNRIKVGNHGAIQVNNGSADVIFTTNSTGGTLVLETWDTDGSSLRNNGNGLNPSIANGNSCTATLNGTSQDVTTALSGAFGNGAKLTLNLARVPFIWNGLTWDTEPSSDYDAVIDGTYQGTGFSCNNLIVNAGKQLTVSSGTLAIGGDLILKSDASAGTGSLMTNGTITVSGTTTIERYMTKDAWHVIASPVAGQTVGGFLTAGTIIKKNPSNESNKALKDYNESSNLWNGLDYSTSTSDQMAPGKGYAVWPDQDGVVRFTGNMLSGDQPVTVARTGDNGWNCIGNPYLSALKINHAIGNSDFIYANSGNLDESYGAVYLWNQSSNSYLPIRLADAADYITSGQGFFVKVKTGASQIDFTPAMQTHNPSVSLRSSAIDNPCITIGTSQGSKKSQAKIYLQDGCTEGLDFGYDAGAFKSDLTVYTKLVEDNGVDFAVQSLPPLSNDGYVIPVGLETTENGTVSFEVKAENVPEGYTILFEDLQNNQSLKLNEESKTMVCDAKSGVTSDRFYVSVNKTQTGLEMLHSEIVTVGEGEILIRGEVKTGSMASLYDLQGRCLSSCRLTGGSLNRIDVQKLSKGIYVLEIRQEGKAFTKKIVLK